MYKYTCGITSVIIGREYSIQPLFNYFKEVEFPTNMEVSLYLVIGCDSTFEELLNEKIVELQLDLKYKKIHFLRGNLKLQTNMNWDKWESYVRINEPDKKHRAALYNIEIGLEAAKNNTYIHFVDDDTIPPKNTLKDLLKVYQITNNCGLSSGIYFNKQWGNSKISLSKSEQIRNICGSYKKNTWVGCSIDDLAIENYKDVGFVGNGCMLVSGEDIKSVLPLSEYRDQNDDIAPPDFIICRRIRNMGKIISIVPSVIAQHLDFNGNPVGLHNEYLENIKKSTTNYNFLITNYDKYLNYHSLNKRFDKVIIINYRELYKELPKYLNTLENVEIVQTSIEEICKKYSDYKNYYTLDGETMKHIIMHEAYKLVNRKSDYVMYYYDFLENEIKKIPLLDSTNLKKLLNQTV